MSVTNNLNYRAPQLRAFARLFKEARMSQALSQLDVARAAFDYDKSHCKVSRVERARMRLVDAHCLERMATALQVPREALRAIDPDFDNRVKVIRAATVKGFWH